MRRLSEKLEELRTGGAQNERYHQKRRELGGLQRHHFVLNYQLFHWLSKPLYRINETLFGSAELGLKGQPPFVVFFQFLIPVILFLVIVMAGYFLCKKIEEKKNQ